MADAPNVLQIGQTIRNAVVFNPKNWAGDTLDTSHLVDQVARLFQLLDQRGVDYVLVGGIVMLQYIEGRNTEGIDFVISETALTHLPEIALTRQDEYFAQGHLESLRVDFLLTSNPLFQTVQQQYATQKSFQEQRIPCATVEGLLLLKLYALPSLYRQGNFARVGLYENDIATLLNEYQPDLAPLFEVLSEHLGSGDMESLQEIVAEIELRIKRFKRGLSE